MLNWLRKRQTRQLNTLEDVGFMNRIESWRVNLGFPEGVMTREQLVRFYAMNLAQIIFEKATGLTNVLAGRDPAERVATSVVMIQIVHRSCRACLITEQETKGVIILNCFAALMDEDVSEFSPEIQAVLALTQTVNELMQSEHLDTLRQIDRECFNYLMTDEAKAVEALKSAWHHIHSQM